MDLKEIRCGLDSSGSVGSNGRLLLENEPLSSIKLGNLLTSRVIIASLSKTLHHVISHILEVVDLMYFTIIVFQKFCDNGLSIVIGIFSVDIICFVTSV
jgi:hypothetical protein